MKDNVSHVRAKVINIQMAEPRNGILLNISLKKKLVGIKINVTNVIYVVSMETLEKIV